MCGTLVAALSLSGSRRVGPWFHALYNAGRIGTYGTLGWAAGHVGLSAARCGGAPGLGRALMLTADAFVIAAGLATAGGLGWLSALEDAGRGLGRAVAVGVAWLRRRPPALAALPLGATLGLLPCGLLYAVLVNAALTADPSEGAALMLGFGAGTSPSLLAFAGAAHLLGARTRGWLFRAAGLSVALMGAFNLGRHLTGWSCH